MSNQSNEVKALKAELKDVKLNHGKLVSELEKSAERERVLSSQLAETKTEMKILIERNTELEEATGVEKDYEELEEEIASLKIELKEALSSKVVTIGSGELTREEAKRHVENGGKIITGPKGTIMAAK